MNKQHLISAITQSMGQRPTPFALIDQETLSIEFMNPAFEQMLPAHVLSELGERSAFLADDAGTSTAIRQCVEKKAAIHCVHPDLGLRLQFSPLLNEGDLWAVQCFALQGLGGLQRPLSEDAPALPEEMVHSIARIPAHIWLCRPNGEVFWLSESLRHYLYGPDSNANLTDGCWIEAIHPGDITRTNAWFLQFMLNQSGDSVDFRLYDYQGDLQWFQTRAQLVLDKDGQLDYVMGTSINIQAFKERELRQALEREQIRKDYQANLERTRAVQEQLAQTQKRELLESIAGGVAHDLNNLLFVINLNSNLLKKRLPDEQSQGYLEVIQKTVKRANRLATQLTSFSGRKSQSRQPADPRALVEDVEELLLNAVGAEVDFKLELAEPLGVIEVDKAYFENALLNLAINARDAVQGRGKVWVKVYNKTLHSLGAARSYVVVEVGDNGTGMPEEVQRRIFDPFYTTKEVGKGNGLGLPMVQSFAYQCDGFVEVQSQPGQGTQFFLYLPQSQQPVPAEPSPAPLTGQGQESVLIVEDDVAVRNSLAEALYDQGYRVSTAYNADVALKYIRGGMQVDIIVSDIRMPGQLTAPQMLSILEQENYKMAVLLITGYSGDVLIEDGLLNQQYPVLFKPFSIHELGSKIREVLAQHRA